MALSTFKCLISILFLTLLVTKGSCEVCNLNNITIGTIRTGRVIQGKSEWKVIVVNNCSCAQSHIRLSCQGFQSVENVSPSIFSKSGDSCLLINGNLLKAKGTITFTYAWDPPFLMFPLSSIIGPC
ncbi:protein TAPETUM DETERMINANT 1-like [Lotus japonicus]|uniref:protein TAPETUM DETERMINANT 1-like n=1 Tax=Lotus japonicus TaxID=34305 RepID=UPI002586FC86|nr:protein TAPETUM DETERMINANT 1-like [Lotus japonicus]